MHYLALEQFPLTPDMLRHVLALQPELADFAALLLAHYPARLPGWHRLHFGEVTLTLGFGEAATLLAEMETGVDAWYLDGFSPAKNPTMWSEAVFTQMARVSRRDTSFATFTAASAVRRGLQAVGFNVRKVPGFGYKREMLVGVYSEDAPLRDALTPTRFSLESDGGITPFDMTFTHVEPPPQAARLTPTQRSSEVAAPVLVIGGGIAGCSIAHALAIRGRKVTLLSEGIADAASGNAVAVLFPQLSKRWLPSTAWFFAGMDFAQRQLQQLQQTTEAHMYGQPGILRLPRHTDEESALRRIHEALGLDASIAQWVDAAQASHLAGLELATGAAYLPHGTWASPVDWCRALMAHPNVTLRNNTRVVRLRRVADGWVAVSATGEEFFAAQLCLANAQHANALLAQPLRMGVTAGQVSVLPREAVAAWPKAILCHKGYVIARGAQVLIGATYDRDDLSGAVTAENHARNLEEIAKFLPGWAQGEAAGGRTSFRATTPDRMPYVGQLQPGLWVSVGHGSRGMVSAPLAAEIIASESCGEQIPLAPALRHALRPQRGIQ